MRAPALISAVSLFLIPGALAAQTVDTTATPISLTEAIRLAQQNSVTSVQARGSVRTSDAAVKQSYAAFLPTFSVSAGTNHQSGDRFDTQGNLVPFTGNPTNYSTGLSSSLQLFDGGRRFFDVKRTKADVDAAEAGETASKYQVALQVKQQYYNILAARESQSAAQAQIDQAQQQLRASSLRLRAGAATVSDSLRSVVALGNARLALLTAENNLRVANATLSRLIASPRTVTATSSDTLDQQVVIPDIAELTPLVDRAPAIQQADAQLTSAHASLRSAKTSFLPTVNMNFNRSGSGLDPAFGIGDKRYAYNQSLSFSLNFPLFNNLSREVNVARAIVAEDVAEASLRDARLLARQTLVQSLGQMKTAQEQVAIQTNSVAAAIEDLRVQQRRYELGATTLLDLLTSQTQLDNARTALIRARYDYRVAKAQLEALIGRDLQE
ncbi:MAG TPA: TolC family protein [Gemmatimonadaceae bacterium]|nr:TolC family protein [Gemmatimonadaceae bacterium]